MRHTPWMACLVYRISRRKHIITSERKLGGVCSICQGLSRPNFTRYVWLDWFKLWADAWLMLSNNLRALMRFFCDKLWVVCSILLVRITSAHAPIQTHQYSIPIHLIAIFSPPIRFGRIVSSFIIILWHALNSAKEKPVAIDTNRTVVFVSPAATCTRLCPVSLESKIHRANFRIGDAFIFL